VADSLKVLDLKRPIREATYLLRGREMTRRARCRHQQARATVQQAVRQKRHLDPFKTKKCGILPLDVPSYAVVRWLP
jgi:hypothetical protein